VYFIGWVGASCVVGAFMLEKRSVSGAAPGDAKKKNRAPRCVISASGRAGTPGVLRRPLRASRRRDRNAAAAGVDATFLLVNCD